MNKKTVFKMIAGIVLILVVYIGGMMAFAPSVPDRTINVYSGGDLFDTYSGKFDVKVTDHADPNLGQRLVVTATNGYKLFTIDGKLDIEVIGPDSSGDTSGTEKTLNVYAITGKKLATYSGKFDVEYKVGGEVSFNLNGKSYIYYNFKVEVIEK